MYKYQVHYLECKIADFFVLLSSQNSASQVLAMTFDKYLAIKSPHKAATYSTPRRAKIITIAVWVITVMYNIPHIYF